MGKELSQERGLVSIVIPTYNYGEFITDVLDSLTRQTFKYLEVIVIDDGSIDGTMKIVNNWQAKHANAFHNFIYLRLPRNCSASWALNIGFYLARGEFLVIHDADDISQPDKIRQQFLWLREHPDCGAVGTNFYIIKNSVKCASFQNWLNFNRQQIAINYTEKAQHCVCFGTLMFRKDILLNVTGVKKIPEKRNDIIFIKEIINNGYVVDNIDLRLFSVRLHDKQKTGPKDFQKNSFNIFPQRVSVIIPLRYINFLSLLVSRASLQNYPEIEIIIVDDINQDRAEKLINEWESEKNFVGVIKDIIYFRLPVEIDNLWLYNIGSYIAKGKYIYFPGNNSLIDKDELAKKTMLFNKNWLHSGIASNSQGDIQPLNWRTELLCSNFNGVNNICSNDYTSIMVKKEIIDRTAGIAKAPKLCFD